ncbi:MAG: hypothetical protein K8R59_03005, partial [Thermoanaerobaculales bacterium]|nr:hypothetical protein [Thermoanaerobaculales bacterium]
PRSWSDGVPEKGTAQRPQAGLPLTAVGPSAMQISPFMNTSKDIIGVTQNGGLSPALQATGRRTPLNPARILENARICGPPETSECAPGRWSYRQRSRSTVVGRPLAGTVDSVGGQGQTAASDDSDRDSHQSRRSGRRLHPHRRSNPQNTAHVPLSSVILNLQSAHPVNGH